MKARTLLLLGALAVLIAFVALNWNAFLAPTTLSLGVATVAAPLGMVMLGMLALLTAIFLAYVVTLQTSVLLETRRHGRELQAHRELADRAEASRFTELRGFIGTELQALSAREAEAHAALQARLDRLEQTSRASMEETGNSLAAQLGEIEDRLERDVDRPLAPPIVRREH